MPARYWHNYSSHNEQGIVSELTVVVEFGPRREEFVATFTGWEAIQWYRRLTDFPSDAPKDAALPVYLEAVQEKLRQELGKKWARASEYEANLMKHGVLSDEDAKTLRLSCAKEGQDA